MQFLHSKTVMAVLLLMFFAVPEIHGGDPSMKTTTLIPVLRQGFGAIVTVSGTLVDDTHTRRRADAGKILLRVNTVNDRKIETEVIIPLKTFSFAGTPLPAIGSMVTLRGYETGGFRGIPRAAFADIPIVATDEHAFESHFQVTKVIGEKSDLN
jgi:hypothetical protein